jgi:hypothetical protein
LEELLAGEVLEIGVIDPTLTHLLVGYAKMCLSNSSPMTSEFAFSAKVGFEIARIRDLKVRKLAISFWDSL